MMKKVWIGLSLGLLANAAAAEITRIEIKKNGIIVEDSTEPKAIKILTSSYLSDETASRCLTVALFAKKQGLKFNATYYRIPDEGYTTVNGCELTSYNSAD